jgi:hypothetical protein
MQNRGITLRIHPILLSLAWAINESETSPPLDSVSEDDPRALGDEHYTPLDNFPALDLHISGRNGKLPPYDTAKKAHLYKQPTAQWHNVNCMDVQDIPKQSRK